MLVIIVSVSSWFLNPIIGYRAVALLFMVTISCVAMFFDILPVLMTAVLSALIWNYFFITPKFTFSISSAEDLLMFLMYFVIALLNAVLTYKIRQFEKQATLKEEKERALGLYSTLLNSLSHELKTPIATIIGATDNLQALSDKVSERDKHEMISQISLSALRLNRQVNNLLNMSRLESGMIRLRPDWLDVRELVHDVISQLKPELQDKPVAVIVPDNLPLFKLDYGLLSQVIYNLLHNAAVHLPRYAVVTVKAASKAERLELVVEDSGNGFPEAELPRVFEKFYRLSDAKTGGTGLGLSIVKGFVTAMGGTIELRNGQESGAIFTIDIPAELSFVKA